MTISNCEIYLAPMEGVVDATLRNLITAVGGVDRCVTEFLRVSDQCLPGRVFRRLCPELLQGGSTLSGTPVYIQLLGSDPALMAANARRAASLGAKGIDLNFGCPAKTVNKNRGGSILLRETELLHEIVAAVRAEVPAKVPVTAKMRLGYEDKSLALDNAVAICEAGATELCVHARTKVEGYRPPAHWNWIAAIQERLSIPVIANGDMFTLEDIKRCVEVSGCQQLMIGRGLIRQPNLAMQAKQDKETLMSWSELLELLNSFVNAVARDMLPKHAPGRVKQWLAYLKLTYPEAQLLFDDIKQHMTLTPITLRIEQEIAAYRLGAC